MDNTEDLLRYIRKLEVKNALLEELVKSLEGQLESEQQMYDSMVEAFNNKD